MKCPNCPTTNLVMSERQGVEIDYCPSCRGIWLDRGELDKLLDKAISQEKGSQPPQQGHTGYNPYGYGKGKKHWLRDLLD